jgi:hypothetical protein
MALLGCEAQVETHFNSFGNSANLFFESMIVLILTQDRCTIWAKRTMASKTILDALDGTPR